MSANSKKRTGDVDTQKIKQIRTLGIVSLSMSIVALIVVFILLQVGSKDIGTHSYNSYARQESDWVYLLWQQQSSYSPNFAHVYVVTNQPVIDVARVLACIAGGLLLVFLAVVFVAMPVLYRKRT